MKRNHSSSSWQIGRSHSRALIGRDSECETLRGLLTTSELFFPPGEHSSTTNRAVPLDTQRRPQCVLLMGEAGIGKTRLAEDVSQAAQRRDWTVLWSRSYTQEGSIPYRLWIELLRSALFTHEQSIYQDNQTTRPGEQTSRQRQTSNQGQISRQGEQTIYQGDRKGTPLLDTSYAPLAVLLPELYDMLPQKMPQPVSLFPEQEQQRLREAVLAFLRAICEEGPLLLVLDDLQWADTSSCELLAYLVRRLSGFPVLFVGTCRENELASNAPLRTLIAHMQREHTITTLSLAPLTAQQVSRMVAHLPKTMVQYIATQAAGNPFFAEELAHSIGTVLDFQSESQQSEASARLPQTITAALASRMGKLSAPCQQLLANTAVLGGSFAFDLVCSIELANTPPTDEDAVLDLLDEALQAGVLTEEGRGMQITYSFWHPLVVSHLYEQLSATRRASLHRRVATILQSLAPRREEARAATVTYHLVAGGAQSSKIAHYAEVAANSAYALSAYPEAEKYYRLVVEHIHANTADERVHLAFILERLAECMMVRGNFEEARHLYERVLEERHTFSLRTSHSDTVYEAQIDALLW
ncbi:MAG: AAA family ATPase, partial [Chloroflexota bacterium]|nr:AAA family ATPase [Chloroflexota bacterium]